MSGQVSMSGLVSPSSFRQNEQISRSLARLAWLMLTVLGGFVLVGLWHFVMANEQGNVQTTKLFQPFNMDLATVAGPHSVASTITHNEIITEAGGPQCIYADLEVAKTVNNTTPNPGDIITYTVTVTNNGPNNATEARLVDVLPAGVVFGGYTATCGSYTTSTSVWDIGDLANTARATLVITAIVSGDISGTITNTAGELVASQLDPNPDNNEASAVISVTVTGADLAVTKTVNNTMPKAGEVITYTITVINNGPDDATGVRLTDTLPIGMNFGGYKAAPGTYISANGLLEAGELPAGGVITLIITATTKSCTEYAVITNTTNVTADQPDPNLGNNWARVAVAPISAIYCFYLPVIVADYEPLVCTPYDFNNSPGGWPVDNEGQVRTGYTQGNEEYFIQRSIPGMRLVPAPVNYANQYTVEVDIRWDDIGYEYGLTFGQSSSLVPTYAFGIGPDPDDTTKYRYRLYRILTYDKSNDRVTIDCLQPSCWIPASVTPNAVNHMTAVCQGKTIRLYVNNELLLERNDIPYSCAGQVGVFAQSSPTDANAIAYFDNFKVSCPSQSSQRTIPSRQEGIVSSLSVTATDLAWIK
jgi:uncharacterized repeat protein (TIGR01451 family)